jgi:hypothetical protein
VPPGAFLDQGTVRTGEMQRPLMTINDNISLARTENYTDINDRIFSAFLGMKTHSEHHFEPAYLYRTC